MADDTNVGVNVDDEVDDGEAVLAQAREALNEAALEMGVLCGAPFPVDAPDSKHGMVIHPSLSYAKSFAGKKEPSGDAEVRNSWWSQRERAYVVIIHEVLRNEAGERVGTGYKNWYMTHKKPIELVLRTSIAISAWDMAAEVRALESLRQHLSEHQFKSYFMTGMFIETSKKSNVIYIFRRLRPTVAVSFATGTGRILCCLCMHPIGNYEDSFAGAMVPSDDVLAHVLMMRGDEHGYWKDCNQTEAWIPEAAL